MEHDGRALIPIQNFQGISIRLDKGVQIGVASPCETELELDCCERVDEPEPKAERSETVDGSLGSMCASIKALANTPEHYAKLMSLLSLPDGLDACEVKRN